MCDSSGQRRVDVSKVAQRQSGKSVFGVGGLGIAILAALLLSACSAQPTVKGNVLSRNQSVVAANGSGEVRISYVSPTRRRYEWDGQSRVVRMRVRAEPFMGKTGLYDPADAFVGDPRTRLVVQESTMNFDNEEQMYDFLRQEPSMDWVYTRDGLVLGFDRTPSRQQLNIDLYQFIVRGKPPSEMNGARPQAIHLVTH
jgi:hypothetical protein